MLHDCDFLDRVEPLRCWLGFETSRNPFFVPLSNQSGPSGGGADIEGCRPLAEAWPGKTGLADVGRQSSLGPFEVSSALENLDVGGKKAWTRSGIKRKVQSTDGASPYAAAVVNDPRLLPPTKGLPPSRGGGPSSADSGFPQTSVSVNVEGLVPNIVTREDMERVGVARRVLIEEEMHVAAARAVAVGAEEGESRSPTRSSNAPTPRNDSRNTPSSSLDSRYTPSPTLHSRKKASKSHEGLALGNLDKRPRKVPFYAASSASARTAPSTPISPNGDLRSLSLSAAGLMQQPPPEPHPGLGPVLLQSDLPGGELHRNPFLHTVTNPSIDERPSHAIGLATSASEELLKTATARGRCCTAPAVPLVSDDFVEPRETFDFSGHFSTDSGRRAATAPSTTSLKSLSPTPTVTAVERAHSSQSRQRGDSKGSARLSAIRSRRVLSRKAGAELRALTAAGTTGRRQPPPREARLRRLARDVERHTAELRNLAREEKQLGRRLASANGSTREESFSSERADSVHTILVNVDDRPAELGVGREGMDLCRSGAEAEAEGALGSRAAAEGPGTIDLKSQVSKVPGQACRASTEHGVASLKEEAKFGKQQYQQTEGADIRSVHMTGSPVDTVEALLEAKRREIALKSFHLGIKRNELRCLLMVQKHERHRKKDLELERLRTRLEEGQVRPTLHLFVVFNDHFCFPAL